MNPVALRLAYDGTDFAGWQQQPDQPTIQGLVQRCLDLVHGEPPGAIALVGAGRTDAGVHALGQVASYLPPTPRPPEVLHHALAGLLPEAIRVLDVWSAPEGFHARRSARSKVYRYRILNRPLALPFETRWSWWVQRPLDIPAMRAAAHHFVGRRDFAALASAGGQCATTVRTLRTLSVAAAADGTIVVEAEADGFLYRMVRNLAGFLVETGLGRRQPAAAEEVLRSRRRPRGGLTAPARGLCLVRVAYDDEAGQESAAFY
jgi:tRNA pseudouridine38-40 synthase